MVHSLNSKASVVPKNNYMIICRLYLKLKDLNLTQMFKLVPGLLSGWEYFPMICFLGKQMLLKWISALTTILEHHVFITLHVSYLFISSLFIPYSISQVKMNCTVLLSTYYILILTRRLIARVFPSSQLAPFVLLGTDFWNTHCNKQTIMISILYIITLNKNNYKYYTMDQYYFL